MPQLLQQPLRNLLHGLRTTHRAHANQRQPWLPWQRWPPGRRLNRIQWRIDITAPPPGGVTHTRWRQVAQGAPKARPRAGVTFGQGLATGSADRLLALDPASQVLSGSIGVC